MIKSQAGLNSYKFSVKEWKTNAVTKSNCRQIICSIFLQSDDFVFPVLRNKKAALMEQLWKQK